MRKLLLALTLCVTLTGRALAGDPLVDALKARFDPQEQILLAVILADRATSAAFAQDARKPISPEILEDWRGRIAVGARDYMAASHATNEKAKSVQEMVEPGEWSALVVTLRFLANGGITDQAKFKVFLAMIEEADAGLKEGDPTEAIKVLKMARPKLVEGMTEYLASDTGKKALAAGDAARKKRVADAAALAQAEAARRKAEQAAKEQPAVVVAPKKPVKQPVVVGEKPKKEETVPVETKPIGDGTALEQARDASKPGQAGVVYDGSTTKEEEENTVVVGGGDTKPEGSGLKPSTGGSVPNLAVIPPEPKENDDLAELRKMKGKVSGAKKWWAAGGGALLGGLLGFLIGGPIGAIIGAALGGGGGFLIAKKFWG